MAKEQISVDDLLASQSKARFNATVEAIEGEPDLVKITPWTATAGCLCHLSMNILKASLMGVTPTENTHLCCGKMLKVVELNFKKGESIKLEDVFGQLSASARDASSVAGGASPQYGPGQGPKGDPPPWGWGPPPWWPYPWGPTFPHPFSRFAHATDYAEPDVVTCFSAYSSCTRACGRSPSCLAGCLEQYMHCERFPKPLQPF